MKPKNSPIIIPNSPLSFPPNNKPGRKKIKKITSGYVMVNKSNGDTIPLLSNDVTVHISGYAQSVTIRQVFKNTGTGAAEFLYCFPKQALDAIYSLTCTFTDTVIEAKAEEKEKAFQKFVNAADNGEKAVLLDFETSDLSSLAIANVPAGEEVVVCLKMIQLITPRNGKFRVQYPAYISERYFPHGHNPEQADRLTNPQFQKTAHTYSFKAIAKTNEVSKITGVSFPIAVEIKEDEYHIELRNNGLTPAGDIILEFDIKNAEAPEAYYAKHSNGDVVVFARFTPELSEEPSRKIHELEFVVDCSGSMSGERLSVAMNALTLCIKGLMPGSKFNITLFGSDYFSFSGSAVEYNEESYEDALKFIEEYQYTDLGGTETARPLSAILGIPVPEGHRRTILLITDGDVGNVKEIISLAQNRGTRIFTFGIGEAVGSALVKDLAVMTGGECEMLSDLDDAEEKVLAQLARAEETSQLRARLIIKGSDTQMSNYSSVYPGEPALLVAFVPDAANLNRAEIKIEQTGETISLNEIKEIQDDVPATAFVYEYVKRADYSEGKRFGRIQHRKDKMLKLAIKYNLVTPYTSFVGVESENGYLYIDEPLMQSVRYGSSPILKNNAEGVPEAEWDTEIKELFTPAHYIHLRKEFNKYPPASLHRSVKQMSDERLDVLHTQKWSGCFRDSEAMLLFIKLIGILNPDNFSDLEEFNTTTAAELENPKITAELCNEYIVTLLFIKAFGNEVPQQYKAAHSKAQFGLERYNNLFPELKEKAEQYFLRKTGITV